jgi:hypothetical protein
LFEQRVFQVDHPAGEVTTRLLEGRILETRYTGYCSTALVASVCELTPQALREVPGACWLLDMEQLTGVDPGVRTPGRAILEAFRDCGGQRFAVLTNARARYLFSAVAYAVGLPVRFFAAREEALAWLREAGDG